MSLAEPPRSLAQLPVASIIQQKTGLHVPSPRSTRQDADPVGDFAQEILVGLQLLSVQILECLHKFGWHGLRVGDWVPHVGKPIKERCGLSRGLELHRILKGSELSFRIGPCPFLDMLHEVKSVEFSVPSRGRQSELESDLYIPLCWWFRHGHAFFDTLRSVEVWGEQIIYPIRKSYLDYKALLPEGVMDFPRRARVFSSCGQVQVVSSWELHSADIVLFREHRIVDIGFDEEQHVRTWAAFGQMAVAKEHNWPGVEFVASLVESQGRLAFIIELRVCPRPVSLAEFLNILK